MKKAVCILTIIFCVLLLSACNVNTATSHTHDYILVNYNENAHWLECECKDKAAVEFHKGGAATCTDLAVCSVCSVEYGRLEPHNYAITNKNEDQHWSECSCGDKKAIENHSYTILRSNETEHWYECICGDKKNVEAHRGGVATETEKAECSVCNAKYGDVRKATEGLTFVLDENKTGYAVSRYYGTSESVYIPSTYLGKPVTTISEDAFSFGEAVFITSITIPDSVVIIEDNALACAVKAVLYCEAKSKPAGWDDDWNYSEFWSYMPVVWDYKNNNIADDRYIYGITIDGINYAIKDTEAKVVGTNVAGNITVPETIVYNETSYTVTSIGCAALAFNNSASPEGWSTGFSLTGVNLPNTLRSIEMGAFCGCYSLTSMVIPDGVTNIAWGAFATCSSLTSVEIPDSVINIGEYAFQLCALISVTIPGSVLNIAESAFVNCNSLASIIVGEDNPNYASIDGNLYSKDGRKLLVYAPDKSTTTFTIPEDVTSIGANAFYNCSSLTAVVIPSSVAYIESRAFAFCESLTVYCEASSRPDGWSAEWIYSWYTPCYWSGDWKFDMNGVPTVKKAAYVGGYALHHIDVKPISGGQTATYNLGDFFFGTVLSKYTIHANISIGTGSDYISYNFGNGVHVSCNFAILDDSTAVAYLDGEVDLFNNGNSTDILYFDIVEIDGQTCFVLNATYGQNNYAYYVVKSSI